MTFMLKVSILGMEDGDHTFTAETAVSAIQDMFPEFTGVISVTGTIKKQGKRLMLNAEASCNAHLICDVSGEEFDQEIKAPINAHYRLDTQLYSLSKSQDEGNEIILRDDEEDIDFTEESRQELAIHLPMKRVAPAYADTTFEALHQELLDETNKVVDDADSPFAALKHLNIQKN
ncbi:MAG: DUF177 domain-containing protein [Ignavibacteria bacterium]|nr:DUF177 domain-containing protein [Ignavibacteria bacterium]